MTHYAFLVPGKSFGGLEIQTVRRAAQAKERGLNPIVICRRNSRVHHFANSLKLQTEFIHVTYPYIDVFAVLEIQHIFKKYEISICVVAATKFLGIASAASKCFKNKTKIYLYQQLQSAINKKDFYHNLIYKRLAGAVVLTERMKKELLDTTIIQPEKVSVIPYGLDVDSFHPDKFNKKECRTSFELPEDKYLIGYIARIDDNKDQLTAIRAFHKAEIPNSLLVLCGHVDPEFNSYHLKLNNEIEELGIGDKVIFLPFTEEIPKLMNSFDAFIMSSRAGTFGLVTIEAMAAGLPIAAVDVGGTPELIMHEENGFLVGQEDADAFAKYLKLIYDSPETTAKFRESNLKEVKDRFDLERQTDAFFGFVK